jgi:hypothetical protein
MTAEKMGLTPKTTHQKPICLCTRDREKRYSIRILLGEVGAGRHAGSRA